MTHAEQMAEYRKINQVRQANQNAIVGSIVGSMLRIKPELTRYSPCVAAVIPVTQEWVDETQKALNSLIRERDEALAEVARLTTPPVKQEPAFDFDRAWNRTAKARNAFGGF